MLRLSTFFFPKAMLARFCLCLLHLNLTLNKTIVSYVDAYFVIY